MGGSVPDDWLVLVWSLVLLVSCLALNIAALLLLLRSAGSCHSDPGVPAVLSVLASNILHSLLVQVFRLHQAATGTFMFTEQLCTLVQVNQGILTDVPFTTICLQLMVALRGLRKTRAPYTYFHVCCGSLAVVSLPWLIAVLTHTVTPLQPHILQGHCLLYPKPPLVQYIARYTVALALPTACTLVLLLASLPSLCSCTSLLTWQWSPLLHHQKRDLLLLGTMCAVHLLLQGPRVAVQGLLWYQGLQAEVILLTVNVLGDLPLVLHPLAVLTLRPGRGRGIAKEVILDRCHSEENLALVVSMDGRQLETALAASKTTIL